jgi:hypothetical protein
MTLFPYILLVVLSGILLIIWSRWRQTKRADFIRTYMFPPGLLDKLLAIRPDLTIKDRQLVARALRQFFLAYHKSGYQPIAMPSQVVDDLWHEFILYTKNYSTFCQQAFGRYMHHTPAAVLGENQRNNDGLRRTWRFACLEENINPRRATRLPLLFALDAKWNIPNGFRYEADCRVLRKSGDGTVYCGGDFSGGTASSSAFDDSDISDYLSFPFSSDSSSDSSSSSDSGSDGGSSGCSGGCSGGD